MLYPNELQAHTKLKVESVKYKENFFSLLTLHFQLKLVGAEGFTPGFLPFALRAALCAFKIVDE